MVIPGQLIQVSVYRTIGPTLVLVSTQVPIGPVSISVEVQRDTDGDTPSTVHCEA